MTKKLFAIAAMLLCAAALDAQVVSKQSSSTWNGVSGKPFIDAQSMGVKADLVMFNATVNSDTSITLPPGATLYDQPSAPFSFSPSDVGKRIWCQSANFSSFGYVPMGMGNVASFTSPTVIQSTATALVTANVVCMMGTLNGDALRNVFNYALTLSGCNEIHLPAGRILIEKNPFPVTGIVPQCPLTLRGEPSGFITTNGVPTGGTIFSLTEDYAWTNSGGPDIGILLGDSNVGYVENISIDAISTQWLTNGNQKMLVAAGGANLTNVNIANFYPFYGSGNFALYISTGSIYLDRVSIEQGLNSGCMYVVGNQHVFNNVRLGNCGPGGSATFYDSAFNYVVGGTWDECNSAIDACIQLQNHSVVSFSNFLTLSSQAVNGAGVHVDGTSKARLSQVDLALIVDSGGSAYAVNSELWSVVNNGTFVNSAGNTFLTVPTGSGLFLNGTQEFSKYLTAQTSAIPDTSMITVGASSAPYIFNGTIACTTSSAAATATLNLKYTDVSGTSQTVSATATCTSLGAASVAQISQTIYAKNATNITYGVTIANTPTYDVSVSLAPQNILQ
jgi:hypothetical protein